MRVLMEMIAGLIAGLSMGLLIEMLRAARFGIRLSGGQVHIGADRWQTAAALTATRLRRKLTVMFPFTRRRA